MSNNLTAGEKKALGFLSTSFGYVTKGKTEFRGGVSVPLINVKVAISLARKNLVYYSPGFFSTISLKR